MDPIKGKGSTHTLWARLVRRLPLLLALSAMTGAFAGAGCMANHATSHLKVWEGPKLQYGRMSATLGSVMFKDGRLMVVGGSPTEEPFVPYEGTKAIEIADSNCILSQECIQKKDQCKCWYEAGIDVKYPLAGFAYPLPDGRVIVFSSVFVFDPDSDRLDPKAPDKNTPTSGPVSAVIIDLKKKSVTPIYRPKGNKFGNPPLKGNFSLLQRAFDRSLQLRDGRIIRIGGQLRYTGPTPIAKCEQQRCVYCTGSQCGKPEPFTACNQASDCPGKYSRWDKIVMPDIEIYTPPDANHPLGSVKYLKMNEGRSSVLGIELQDGRVLISGGWGPKGVGENQDYNTTYFLDPNKPSLTPGPKMLFYREDHAGILLKDGRVLITGGTDANAKTGNTSEIFDPKRGIFDNAPSMTSTREDHVPLPLGPWVVFLGGEVNDKADQIRNTIEIFDATTAAYIGPIFMFSRPSSGEDAGLAGVTDFAVFQLNKNTILLTGGQQGLQDRDGEYISAGKGSRRTLLMRYTP